jgi:hypothetical protein
MNARQKAKHFKRLYEMSLPTKPYPIVFETHKDRHFRASFMLDARDVVYRQENPTFLKQHIENRILQEIRPIIWDNLKTEKDKYTDNMIYTLDFWI